MLPVKPVLDQIPILVKLVKDEIGICLMGCSEDDDLIQPGHISEEANAERSDLIDHTSVLEMHQCLIQVKH